MFIKSHAFTIHFNMTKLSTLRLHIVALKARDVHRFLHIMDPFCHGSRDCNQHTNHRLLAVLTFIPELLQGKTNAGNPYMIYMHLGRKHVKTMDFSRGFTPKKSTDFSFNRKMPPGALGEPNTRCSWIKAGSASTVLKGTSQSSQSNHCFFGYLGNHKSGFIMFH